MKNLFGWIVGKIGKLVIKYGGVGAVIKLIWKYAKPYAEKLAKGTENNKWDDRLVVAIDLLIERFC